jgi:hypothetical protein
MNVSDWILAATGCFTVSAGMLAALDGRFQAFKERSIKKLHRIFWLHLVLITAHANLFYAPSEYNRTNDFKK